MVSKTELMNWLATLPNDAEIGIHDDCMMLAVVGSDDTFDVGGCGDNDTFEGDE